jgi:cytochrome b
MDLKPKTSITVMVWDLPLRIFHWLLVVGVLGAYITATLGGSLIDWHGYFGVLVLGLLLFRLIWGFAGTFHARFANFIPTPARLLSYINGQWQGVGHNPLGALAVFAILITALFIASSGLFANDDIAFQGTWSNLIDKALSDTLSAWHSLAFDVLSVLIVLHIAAIGFYRWHKQQNLVLPMLTGKKRLFQSESNTSENCLKRFLVVLAVTLVLTWSIYRGLPDYFSHSQTNVPPATTSSW